MSNASFETLCLVEFTCGVSVDLINYVYQRIQSPKLRPKIKEEDEDNCCVHTHHDADSNSSQPKLLTTSLSYKDGAELQCLKQMHSPSTEDGGRSETQAYIHVGCSIERLLEIADYVDMKKRCHDGTMQVFRQRRLKSFENGDNLENFFTIAEKQWLTLHEIESIKVTTDNFKVPGNPNIELQLGSSLIKQCERYGLSRVFPLHDDSLPKLEQKWYRRISLSTSQPIEEIKGYFGETIGMYFAFLDFYSSALVLPAGVGLFFYMFEFHKHSLYSLMILAVFNLIWSTAFMESWKRKANGLAYSWGTTDIKIIEEARPNFYGELSKNRVTDKVEPRYPKWKRLLRFYFISLPCVIFCLSVSLAAMFAYIRYEDYMIAWFNKEKSPGVYENVWSFVPTVLYSIAIIVMNQLYRPLAVQLNEWENHRLQSTFDNHLTIKLVMFWFINTFILMFYIAFYQQDLVMLRKTVLTELIVTQTVDQLQETVVPYAMYRWRKRSIPTTTASSAEDSEAKTSQPDTYRIDKEARKDVYQGVFDDYLELFIQYGYVTLFSCVSPLAAILSLINNYIEQRTDAVKLCRIHQRPFSKPTAGIGAWQVVFDVMGYLAIITNSALIGLFAYKADLLPDTSNFDLLLIIIGLEHALIAIRVGVAHIIPDAPKWVEVAMARDAYQLKTKYLSMQDQEPISKKTQ